mmetsp:Transcript_2470/g.4492  ORF Transcript_2470/g.4492 Transcript_2470/m.4492 type:complete len:586 (+) Transcript_2470:55-1812(+)
MRSDMKSSTISTDQNSGTKPQVREAWGDENFSQQRDVEISTEESIMNAIRVMQSKYSQNIEIIDQLYREKEAMAEQVKQLEETLQESQYQREVSVSGVKELAYDFDFNEARESYMPKADVQSSTNELVSATEAANIFGLDDAKNINTRGSYSDTTKNRKTGKKAFGLSPQLQADTDRYLQKIKYIQDKKRLEILEQEKYELELEKRRLRAAKCGSEFTRMREREEKALEIRKRREERKQSKEFEREAKSLEEKNRTIVTHANLRNSLKNSKNWDEIQKEEEIKRRDRIEKRKQQLTSLAAYPSSSINLAVDRWKEKDLKEEIPSTILSNKGHTPSPAEIGAQLRRRQEKWEMHLQHEKELLNSKRRSTLPVRAAIDMENRNRVHDENKKQRQLAKEQKEMEEKERKAAEDRKRTRRIMRRAVPESSRRLTKASEDRAKAVRDSFEKARKKEMQEKKREEIKSRRSKEVSAFLTTLVGGVDNKMTEAARNEISRQQAAENAAAFKENRKRNQQRIRASLAQRPSLIERHNMAIASTGATSSALAKVANVVKPTNSHKSGESQWRDDFESEELFDEDEMIQLGIRDH